MLGRWCVVGDGFLTAASHQPLNSLPVEDARHLKAGLQKGGTAVCRQENVAECQLQFSLL
jgi:hypothetical protein